MRTTTGDLTISGMLADRRLLIVLFIGLRLILLITYMPLFTAGVERGISAGGDFFYYFQLAGLSGDGLLPFRDWWSEFPPIPAFLFTGIFALLGGNANYTAFAMLLGLIMVAFDVGNLLLIRSLGARLHGNNTGIALGWVYAVAAAPLVFVWWNFEPMVAFFMLLSLSALLAKRDTASALWAGVGALVKFTPAVILGAVWRFRKPGAAARYTVIVALIFGVVYAILLVQNASMTLPSLTAQFNKASYQTVWALIDGNFRTGNFGSVLDHLDPARANDVLGNAAVIPGVVRLIVAAALGAWVYARTRCFDDKGLLAFAAITLLIFFLQAQGWSPQWMAQIAPLILLCFPTRDGALIVVLLSVLTFVEYPFLFIRTGDSGGAIAGALVTPFALVVVLRTLILVGVCVALYRRLRQAPVRLS
jgi:hypothetical protein